MGKYLSLKDHVYNFIQERINDGTLAANEKINEQLIQDELQISRTPVREALIQLSTEGYIENIPRRGFIVKPIDEKKATELYTLIGVLDGLAASLATPQINAEDIEEMKAKIDKIYQAIRDEDYKSYAKLQTEFHDIYINKCDNEELIRFINQIRRNFMKHSFEKDDNEHSVSEILEATNKEHETIVDLFEKKDAQSIESFIRHTHWSNYHARLEKL